MFVNYRLTGFFFGQGALTLEEIQALNAIKEEWKLTVLATYSGLVAGAKATTPGTMGTTFRILNVQDSGTMGTTRT